MKRQLNGSSKKTEHEVLLSIEISQPHVMKHLIENAANVLKTAEIHVVKTEEFEGIKIETLDELSVCLVIAQMPCSVYMSDNFENRVDKSFTISIEWLLVFLRQIDVQNSIFIQQFVENEDEVKISSRHTETNEDEITAVIKTLINHNSEHKIDLKSFPVSFTIEMDLFTVRSFLKNCDSIKSDDVEIIVEEYATENDDENNHQNVTEEVTIRANDKAAMGLERKFRSVDENGNSRSFKTTTNIGKIVFKEAFATKYLNSFVKNMNKTNVCFQMSTGNPLHINYSLGIRDAQITFILAPRQDVDE